MDTLEWACPVHASLPDGVTKIPWSCGLSDIKHVASHTFLSHQPTRREKRQCCNKYTAVEVFKILSKYFIIYNISQGQRFHVRQSLTAGKQFHLGSGTNASPQTWNAECVLHSFNQIQYASHTAARAAGTNLRQHPRL